MKNMALLFISFCVALYLHAQGPVKWKFSSKKITDASYEVHLTATVDDPWHIYSQTTPKGGPLPTKISFMRNPLITLIGKVKENGEMEMYHEEVFDVDVYAYGGTVDFIQTVKLKNKVKTNVSGSVEFMACTRQQCLTPQTIKFTVKLQ